jgi:hypothetical protein
MSQNKNKKNFSKEGCSYHINRTYKRFKGIVSPDWKGLQMVSLDRFEV